MRIFGFGRKTKEEKIIEDAAKQVALEVKRPDVPPTFKMCAIAFMKSDPGGVVNITRKALKSHARTYLYAGSMTIQEAYDAADFIEDYLKDEYGGGYYVLNFHSSNKALYAGYAYAIDGPMKGEVAGYANGKGNIGFDKFMEQAKFFKEVFAASGNGSNTLEALTTTMLTGMFDNMWANKVNEVDTAVQLLELADKLRPNVEAQDPLTSMVQSFGPIIAQGLMSKGANQQQQASLMDMVNNLSPAEKTALIASVARSLSPQEQQKFAALIGVSAPVGNVGAPASMPVSAGIHEPAEATAMSNTGVSDIAGERSSSRAPLRDPAPPGEPAEGTAAGSPPSLNNPYIEVVKNMMAGFRADIQNGVDPELLATKLFVMIQSAQVNLGADCPEPLRGLVIEEDPAALVHEFDKFCEVIPELAGNIEIQNRLKLHLGQILIDLNPYADDEIPEDVDQPQDEGIADEDHVETNQRPATISQDIDERAADGPEAGGGSPKADDEADVLHSAVG